MGHDLIKAVFQASSQGASKEAVKVERPGGRPVGQRPTRVAALGLQRKGDSMADGIKASRGSV